MSYGLGSENRDLSDYLVMISKMQRPSEQPLHDHYWGSGFLPSRCQGVKLRSARDPVLALRLAERGVRFIQLFHPDWDHHSRLTSWCIARCRDTDQPTAALLVDLERRGLLDDTLVIWGGEFGRGVAGQGDWKSPEAGRDHHPRCFTMFLAGGGVQPGLTYGATDEFSYNVAADPVHVRDLHATVLHLLGIDHERLTHRFMGLDFRLTGVEPARVVREILA